MSSSTIKRDIVRMLDDLSKEDFLTFCNQLRDRREDPRVSLSAVEGKRRWDIADVMVSTFTEPKALQVALQILRQMDRNEEAKTLESKTKVCVDKGDPTLRRTSKGELELKPSEEALKHAPCCPLQAAQEGVPSGKKKPEEVMAEAKACVLSEGGDPSNKWLLLSRVALQFGQYKGQTFKWLLENDVGYTVYLVAGHQKEKGSSSPQDPLTANKDCLVKYAKAYPEVMEKVRLHSAYERAKEKSLLPRQKGAALVGFGEHRSVTLQNLYDSKDQEKIRFVNYLRTMRSKCTPGSKMETAVQYIQKRDLRVKRQPPRRTQQRNQGYRRKNKFLRQNKF